MEILFGVSIFSLYLCTQKTIKTQVKGNHLEKFSQQGKC